MQTVMMLHTIKSGVPDRIYVRSDFGYKNTLKAAGCGTARWAKTHNAWSFPLDPVVVKRILEVIPDAIIDHSLQEWLDSLSDRQHRIYQASTMTEPTRPDDPLWSFQRAAVRVLDEAGSIILGDKMGLGKTPTTCAAIEYIGTARNIIVCPAQVKWQWVEHLKQWADIKLPYMVESTRTISSEAKVIYRGRENAVAELIKQDSFTLILGFEMMRILLPVLINADYDLIVFDEAHRLKNRKAQVTQAATELSSKCIRVWPLTGTPVRNGYEDIYTLLNLVDPIRFNSYWNFVNLHLHTVSNVFGSVDIIGLRNEQEFNSMISVYMLRRTKEEVLPDLPDKIYNNIKIPMLDDQLEVYHQMEKDLCVYIENETEAGTSIEQLISAPNTVAQLIRLRQICLSPALIQSHAGSAKIEHLQDLLCDLHDQQEKVVIFTYFRGFLMLIEQVLDNLGIKYGTIVGGQTAQARYEVQQKLTDGTYSMVVGTAQSMGEGMNLDAAGTAIFTDIDWVPANNEQAEDRLHRGTTKTSPNIIRLIHPGTVESDIWLTCSRKEKVINETIGSAEVIRQMILRRKGR